MQTSSYPSMFFLNTLLCSQEAETGRWNSNRLSNVNNITEYYQSSYPNKTLNKSQHAILQGTLLFAMETWAIWSVRVSVSRILEAWHEYLRLSASWARSDSALCSPCQPNTHINKYKISLILGKLCIISTVLTGLSGTTPSALMEFFVTQKSFLT